MDSIEKDKLKINLDDLLHARGIESQRLEFKAGWSELTQHQIIRTISAFANDLLNLNGGYIILGVGENAGRAVLPPVGLESDQLDDIQKKIAGACKSKITPSYIPHIYTETFQKKKIIIIFAPAGESRPYEAPNNHGDGRAYCVRSGSATIEADNELRRQLNEVARRIPFDDQKNLDAGMDAISISLVKKYLTDIRSSLAFMDLSPQELYRKLGLIAPVNNHEVPRNITLLFFSEEPERYFRGAKIEVAQFQDKNGDVIEEKGFSGPLSDQIRSCLKYLEGVGGSLIQKIPGKAEAERTVPYPYESMEEAIVNAVYHRGYENLFPDPVKVYLYPDRMEITSYPGPMPGITQEQLSEGRIPPVPARNRRIEEFLKELRLAEQKGTGISKIQRRMRENGSPEARFDFAENYFRVTLPVHPRYQVVHALREAIQLWAVGEKEHAMKYLAEVSIQRPESGALASQLVEYAFSSGNTGLAKETLDRFERQPNRSEPTLPFRTLARLFADQQNYSEANQCLDRMPQLTDYSELIETAILKKRMKNFSDAHRLFVQADASNSNDSKTIQEFAQTKIKLAANAKDKQVKRKLNQEVLELLRRAIQLADDSSRKAWCWYDLAQTLQWLKRPLSEVEEAFQQAIQLLPQESRFQEKYFQWKKRGGS